MLQDIVLAGGCFWGVEAYFKRVKGVVDTEVAYANGDLADPSYEDVCRNTTGHAEVVKITYDDEVVTLESLLKHFFRIIDPTTLNRQGPDVGSQYRTGIYYVDPADAVTAIDWIDSVRADYDRPIVTEVEPLTSYYPAEEYHQDYLDKNPGGYCHIDLSGMQD